MGRQSPLTNVLQYAAARTVLGGAHLLPPDATNAFAGTLGSLACRIVAKRSERARANISRAFPSLTAGEADALVESSWRHMLQTFLVDTIAAPAHISPDGWTRFVEISNVAPLLDHLLQRRPAILLTAHIGSWELMASLLGVLGYPIHALARPIDNPLIDRWLNSRREARGARIITKWGAVDFAQRVLDGNGIVAFIADQNAGERGLFVPFFDRLASSYKAIGLLAMRHQTSIFVGGAFRMGERFRFRLELADAIHPADWSHRPDPLFYITARYNRAIEQMVRRHPEQYVWVHRRWKSRPRHERLGKPFPPSLLARLQSLPWMTPDQLDRIVRDSITANPAPH